MDRASLTPGVSKTAGMRAERRLFDPARKFFRLLRTGLLLLLGCGKAILFLFVYWPKTAGKFALGAVGSVALCCGLAALYYVAVSPFYVSKWSLILPTSSTGTSMQLESIGNAQSITSSPFGSASLSPKVVYKEIADSETVRLAAANALGMSLSEFGRPRIKLIDETSIMIFEIQGDAPVKAQHKADALINALNRQLDALRADEIARRAKVVEDSLQSYRANLKEARERVLTHQERTGVLSMNQFNEASTSLELLRRRLAERTAELTSLRNEFESLTRRASLDAKMAAVILRLTSEPAFTKFVSEYAEIDSQYQQEATKLGFRNPLLQQLDKRRDGVAFEIERRIADAGVSGDADLKNVTLLLSGSAQSNLLVSLVDIDAKIAGKQSEVESLEGQIKRETDDIKKMSIEAARLEDLNKAHLVAEAVFTSALARLDTNKVDIYSSYPMVQILAPPDLPTEPTGPKLILAIAGALLGSLLSIAAWTMAWIRHIFSRKR